MSVCPSCGHENQPDAKFCSQCATALTTGAPPRREERKVVTVLFADLVGFTSRAERMDPEDVRAFLSPYYSRLRTELERFGGTVEKFIGDAVMALFGAPVGHEDDPERAVRAALAIRDWIREEERLQVRIGINTGEALITLGARPDAGEGMAAGDVINTAARMQTAAPVNGVLVGTTTYRATRHVIDYSELSPVEVKGKDEPVAVWQALEARSRLGVDIPHEAKTELIGRERELDIVRQALGRMRAERSTQLLTIIGVPGIGKSRLLYELSRIVDADLDLFTWRQGRSLPYGEGVSFWALAEMVKAQAGILESDTAEDAQRKLRQTVVEVVPDEDRDWVTRHLQTLLGVEATESAGDTDRRAESFAAWRRFFESVAEHRPLVAVFEDLHWADDGLLEFVDHLVDRAGDVPLLVVGSARPELLERRPGWGGGKPNAVTISLSPLSDDDTARLVKSLLDDPALIDSTTQVIANAGGNPLYAEQFVQMVSEQGSLGELPESIQGIVGARLDALSPTEKRLLQNAAVIGKVFWPGAVATLDGELDAFSIDDALHGLEKKQFVRRDRRSSVARQSQFAFQHVLLRDVAYQQIPRSERTRKHVRTAEWIESLGRTEDQAEMLAHHYLAALELAHATGEDTADIAPRARVALSDAGDRARALNAFASASRFYREALTLWPVENKTERADLLYQFAVLRHLNGDTDRTEALTSARDELLTLGQLERAAALDARLGDVEWTAGNRDAAYAHYERAYEMVHNAPASAEKVDVLSRMLRMEMLANNLPADIAADALGMAESLGLAELRAGLLITIGSARAFGGDPSGVEQMEQGLNVAIDGNFLWLVQRGYTNLGSYNAREGNLAAAIALTEKAGAAALRLGTRDLLRWTQANPVEEMVEVGKWSEVADVCDSFLAESAATGAHLLDTIVHAVRAYLRFARDDRTGALEDVTTSLALVEHSKDPQLVATVSGKAALILGEYGDLDAAGAELDALLSRDPSAMAHVIAYSLVDTACAASICGRTEEFRTWLASARSMRWRDVALMFMSGEVALAAADLDAMGARRTAAVARLYGQVEVDRALEFFREVNATRYIRQAEELLHR